MASGKYFVNIPTSGGGDARGYDHSPKRIDRDPPPLHRSSTRSAEDDQEMYIYIHDMNGLLFTLNVLPSDTINMVKQKIQDCKNIPKDAKQLSYRSRMLEDEYTLKNYNIKRESTLYLHDRNITQGGFVVEQEKKTIMHLDDARMQVPWLLRFRFEKIRNFDVHKYNLEDPSNISLCVSSNPICVTINEVLDPTFRQSREFAALEPDAKREFEDFVRTRETSQHETYLPVDKVCVQVAVGNHDSGKLQFLQSRQWRSGKDRDYMDELAGPRDWRPTVRRETWEKVRENLQVNFGMDLEGAPCNSVNDMTSIVYRKKNDYALR